MEENAETALEGAMGGPSLEDWANGAAALSAALVREAEALASTAAGLRTAAAVNPGMPGTEAMTDVRRQRMVLAAAGDAALRATLALAAAETLTVSLSAPERAARIADAAKRAGLPAASLAPMLRAAAMAVRMDDAAAHVAATTLSQDICASLNV
jgi:hypothetical protein